MPALAPRPIDKGATLLLVAVSARALAQAARRAGYSAIAIDAFGDEDARAACREMWVVENAMGGFAGVDLEPVVARACAAHAPAGIVFGSGFDDCPQKLPPLARYAPLFGSPDGLAAAKTPELFAQACLACGAPHPEIRLAGDKPPGEWLIKRSGGTGGLHVEPDSAGRPLGAGEYRQRRIDGRAVSLLFVRDLEMLTPIAWSEQWSSPAPDAPFRWGGAAGPIDVAAPADILEKLAALTHALGVRGLASADFLDDGEQLWLLEINVRPGATLDLFDDEDDPLLNRHIAAFAGNPAPPAKPRAPAAMEIVYAERDCALPAKPWPEWAADRSPAGADFPSGAPVCTVTARAGSAQEARDKVQQRARRVQYWLQETRLQEGNP